MSEDDAKFRDWTPVVFNNRNKRRTGETEKTFVQKQIRQGNSVSSIKQSSANESKLKIDHMKIRKIANEEETFIHEKVSLNTAKEIARARCEKKLTQKELALQLSLPVKIIQEYESGKAIPNGQVLNKIKKALDMK